MAISSGRLSTVGVATVVFSCAWQIRATNVETSSMRNREKALRRSITAAVLFGLVARLSRQTPRAGPERLPAGPGQPVDAEGDYHPLGDHLRGHPWLEWSGLGR